MQSTNLKGCYIGRKLFQFKHPKKVWQIKNSWDIQKLRMTQNTGTHVGGDLIFRNPSNIYKSFFLTNEKCCEL